MGFCLGVDDRSLLVTVDDVTSSRGCRLDVITVVEEFEKGAGGGRIRSVAEMQPLGSEGQTSTSSFCVDKHRSSLTFSSEISVIVAKPDGPSFSILFNSHVGDVSISPSTVICQSQ